MFDPSPVFGFRTFASHREADARGSSPNLFRVEDIEYSECWSERCVSQVNISANALPATIIGQDIQIPPYKVEFSDYKLLITIPSLQEIS